MPREDAGARGHAKATPPWSALYVSTASSTAPTLAAASPALPPRLLLLVLLVLPPPCWQPLVVFVLLALTPLPQPSPVLLTQPPLVLLVLLVPVHVVLVPVHVVLPLAIWTPWV